MSLDKAVVSEPLEKHTSELNEKAMAVLRPCGTRE